MKKTVEPLAVLASSVAVHKTSPCIRACNFSVCLELLNSCLVNDRFIIFNHLLKTWPHHSLQVQISDERVHYVQSIAILIHQHSLSKMLKEVQIGSPDSGLSRASDYQTTKVLLDAANGTLEDYETLQTAPPTDQRKPASPKGSPKGSPASPKGSPASPKGSPASPKGSRNKITIHAPLNININNAKLLLRYLRSDSNTGQSNIELVPHSLIFTSVALSTVCKVLTAVSPVHHSKLQSLAIHFCIQYNEILEPSYIAALEQFQQVTSLSLTYNFLNGAERERELSKAVQALPCVKKLDLTGNVRCNAYDYMSPHLAELVLTNIYPTADTMDKIGHTCGTALQVLKLSDNGLNTRHEGLSLLLSHCTKLRSLELCGNNYATPSDVTQLLQALSPTKHTLQHLDLSHNLMEEQERKSVVENIATFPGIKRLILGEYLPDLMISEDIHRVERELLDVLGRSDVVSVDGNSGKTRWLYDRLMQVHRAERERDEPNV